MTAFLLTYARTYGTQILLQFMGKLRGEEDGKTAQTGTAKMKEKKQNKQTTKLNSICMDPHRNNQ